MGVRACKLKNWDFGRYANNDSELNACFITNSITVEAQEARSTPGGELI